MHADPKTPLISIVMPAKNASKYLAECLDSILRQSYSNWELLVIDDHSTDETAEILQAYEQEHERVSCRPAEGNGIIDALQQAYKMSNGEYITRMDADDRMAPVKLRILLDNLEAHGRGCLATGCVAYFSEGELGEGYRKYASWLNVLTTSGTNYREIYKECAIPSPCWMLHRIDFERCGGFQSETYPEDYDLCFRFYKSDLKVIPCDKILHHWRDYPQRTSRNHEHYANNTYLKLKVRYFLELDRDAARSLMVWGAGPKGKQIAKLLISNNVQFHWVCNNPNKIGQEIYGVILTDQDHIDFNEQPQIIVAVANPEELEAIKSVLNKNDRQPITDDFYFC